MIRIELPFPPSQNRIWVGGRGRKKAGPWRIYRNPSYVEWLKQADLQWLSQKPRGPFKTIDGPFKVHLKLSRPDRRVRDIDNYHKVVMDWAQRAGIIKNDCNSVETRSGWVTDEEAPMGAVLLITPC